jgi:hypothetical protein
MGKASVRRRLSRDAVPCWHGVRQARCRTGRRRPRGARHGADVSLAPKTPLCLLCRTTPSLVRISGDRVAPRASALRVLRHEIDESAHERFEQFRYRFVHEPTLIVESGRGVSDL